MERVERFLIILKTLIAEDRNDDAIKFIELFQETYGMKK